MPVNDPRNPKYVLTAMSQHQIRGGHVHKRDVEVWEACAGARGVETVVSIGDCMGWGFSDVPENDPRNPKYVATASEMRRVVDKGDVREA